MTLRDLVLALFDCVTTTLGTSDNDVVLLTQPKTDEVSEFNLPVLWEFLSACIKAGSLKTLDPSSVGRELTVKLPWARGKHNKGVFHFEEQGAAGDSDDKRKVKYTVPLSGGAPFIARRIESSEAELQANLRALAQKPEVIALAAKHFKSAFNLSESSRVGAFVKVMEDTAFAVTFRGVPKAVSRYQMQASEDSNLQQVFEIVWAHLYIFYHDTPFKFGSLEPPINDLFLVQGFDLRNKSCAVRQPKPVNCSQRGNFFSKIKYEECVRCASYPLPKMTADLRVRGWREQERKKNRSFSQGEWW